VLVAVQELPGLAFSTETDCRSLLLTTLNTSDPPGFNYLWDFGDNTALVPGDAPDHTYAEPGEYVVTLLSADGCDVQISQEITVNIIDDPVDGEEISCFAEAVVLNPVSVPGYIYQWEPSEFLNNDTIGSPTAQVDVTTTFSVTITDPALPGCSIMEVIEVVVPPDFELNGPPDSAYCDAPTIVLNAGNSDVDYEWFILGGPLLNEGSELIVTPQVETTYEVVGTDDFGCEKRDTFTLTPTFFDLSASTDTIICLGDSIQISITNNDLSQDLSYVWSPAGSIVPPSTPNDPNPIVKPGSSEVYTVQVTNNVLGCITTEEVRVDVSTFMLEYSPSVLICKGESISLNIAGETDNLIFSWEPVDQIDSGADTPNPVVSPEETTVYTAHVVNTDYGCETDLEVTVNVSWFVPDSLEIYFTEDTVILGDTVFVLWTNQTDPGLEFLWSGFPNILPNETSPVITIDPTAGGPLNIGVTVTNEDECVLEGSVALTVLDPPCDDSTVFVPDAFSPNDDGANDEFQIYSNFIESMDLYIYNRWGELVFEAHNQSEHWDGTFKGEKLHPDVFGYYLNVICIPDKPFSKKGNITLFR
jgi:gliding motility-associated-like protein